jgi:hypothetical protein
MGRPNAPAAKAADDVCIGSSATPEDPLTVLVARSEVEL